MPPMTQEVAWQTKLAWKADRSARRNPLVWIGVLMIVGGGITALAMNAKAAHDAGIAAIAASLMGTAANGSAVDADHAGMWVGLVILFIGVAVTLTGIVVASPRRA